MSNLSKLLARVRVVLHAAPLYFVAASAVVQIVADEVAKVLPLGQATALTAVAARVLAVLAAAVAIIRRVTPVADNERGLLPVE